MSKTKQSGFTLIELLVVIAIIGILAAIILASLSTARSKGNDAKVESQMKSIQDASEIYYDSNSNTYASGMSSDTASGLATLFATGNWPNATAPILQASAQAYLAYHALSSGYWCVDATGQSKFESTAPGTGVYVCP